MILVDGNPFWARECAWCPRDLREQGCARLSATPATGGVSLPLQVANAVPSCSQTGPPENSGYWPPTCRTKDRSIAESVITRAIKISIA